jgi:hypothetical protein
MYPRIVNDNLYRLPVGKPSQWFTARRSVAYVETDCFRCAAIFDNLVCQCAGALLSAVSMNQHVETTIGKLQANCRSDDTAATCYQRSFHTSRHLISLSTPSSQEPRVPAIRPFQEPIFSELFGHTKTSDQVDIITRLQQRRRINTVYADALPPPIWVCKANWQAHANVAPRGQ